MGPKMGSPVVQPPEEFRGFVLCALEREVYINLFNHKFATSGSLF